MTVSLFVIRSFGFPSAFDIRISSFPSHLPILQQVIWNLLQEARWPLERFAVTTAQAHLREGEIKLVARACDRHVKQTAFFLQRITGIKGAAAREHAFRQPNDEDRV